MWELNKILFFMYILLCTPRTSAKLCNLYHKKRLKKSFYLLKLEKNSKYDSKKDSVGY